MLYSHLAVVVSLQLIVCNLRSVYVEGFSSSRHSLLENAVSKSNSFHRVNNVSELLAKRKHTSKAFISSTSIHAIAAPIGSISSEDAAVVPEKDLEKIDSVIVGAGPAGLLSAIMLARKFPDQKVKVFDRLSPPPSPTDEAVWSNVAKFYLIGLGSRGQNALKEFGVLNDVEAVSSAVVGRKDWAPEAAEDEGVERIFTDRPVMTQVLPRDKLVGVIHKHIIDNYSDNIELNYGYEVYPEEFEAKNSNAVIVRVAKCDDEITRTNPASAPGSEQPSELCDIDTSYLLSTNLLIAADGTARTVANAMEKYDAEKRATMSLVQKFTAGKPFTVKRYVDDNQRVYKTIPFKLPSEWRPDLNYSSRSKGGRINFDALPADRHGNYCAVLLMRKDDELAVADTDFVELRKLMDENLPQFSKLLDDSAVEEIAKKPPSFLPSFRYAGPRLNQGDRTLILGDCAHTVKPYFGLGANSALEDVQVLDKAIDETNSIPEAVRLFSNKRAGESKALVKLSREFDRPGKLGFLCFVLPLILDSIFHRIAPKLFGPNTIAMLQLEGIDFREVRRKKRLDRIGQIAVLGLGAVGFSWGVTSLVKGLAKASGKNNATVVAGLLCLGVIVRFSKKMLFFLDSNLAPADVLAKTKDTVAGSDTFVTPLGMRKGNDMKMEDGAGI